VTYGRGDRGGQLPSKWWKKNTTNAEKTIHTYITRKKTPCLIAERQSQKGPRRSRQSCDEYLLGHSLAALDVRTRVSDEPLLTASLAFPQKAQSRPRVWGCLRKLVQRKLACTGRARSHPGCWKASSVSSETQLHHLPKSHESHSRGRF